MTQNRKTFFNSNVMWKEGKILSNPINTSLLKSTLITCYLELHHIHGNIAQPINWLYYLIVLEPLFSLEFYILKKKSLVIDTFWLCYKLGHWKFEFLYTVTPWPRPALQNFPEKILAGFQGGPKLSKRDNLSIRLGEQPTKLRVFSQ